MTFKKSNEAFWWSLFSAGGVLAAMFLPAFVLIAGLILPNQSTENPGRDRPSSAGAGVASAVPHAATAATRALALMTRSF